MSAPSPRPTNIAGEPTDPSRDVVLIAVRGLAAGVLAGVGVLPVFLALGMQYRTGATSGPELVAGAAFPLIVGGLLVSIVVAAAVTWWLLAPLGSPFRRGVLAMVAGFGTFVGAMLATPVHVYAGLPGLVAMAVLGLAGAFALVRRAARRPAPEL
jgi:hypothetical protein